MPQLLAFYIKARIYRRSEQAIQLDMTALQIERLALTQGVKLEDARKLVEDIREEAERLRRPEHLDFVNKLFDIPPEQLAFLRPKSVYGDDGG